MTSYKKPRDGEVAALQDKGGGGVNDMRGEKGRQSDEFKFLFWQRRLDQLPEWVRGILTRRILNTLL